MLKKVIKIIIITILCFLICNNPNKEKKKNIINKISQDKIINLTIPKKESLEDNIGTLIIEKINVKQNFYRPTSTKNNVEQNVTILDGSITPEKENSIFFLAAHSGTGKLAYFKDLNKLVEKDIITLIYKDKYYYYEVKDSWEIKKNGSIKVTKERKNQLILTTCSPTKNNYQLIINCIEKEPI